MQIELVSKEDLVLLEQRILEQVTKLIQSTKEQKPYLRSAQVRKMLADMPSSSLAYHRQKGNIKAKKVGGTFFYEPESVEEFLKKN